jgi:hypothetical protein
VEAAGVELEPLCGASEPRRRNPERPEGESKDLLLRNPGGNWWRRRESNPSSALKILKLLKPRMPEISRIPRLPGLRTNRVQTIPGIPQPPTASPSNPFSGPSEEFFIVYTSNDDPEDGLSARIQDGSAGTASECRRADNAEVASSSPDRDSQ